MSVSKMPLKEEAPDEIKNSKEKQVQALDIFGVKSDYIQAFLDNLIVCHICSGEFNSNNSLKSHMKTKHHEQLIKCEHCPRKFLTKVSLNLHTKEHQRKREPKATEPTEDKGGYCNICQSDILNYLRGHMKECYIKYSTRVDPKIDFPCTLCKSRPKSLQSHSGHMQLYHPEASYSCNICVRKFNHTYVLEKHQREVHTRLGKKAYSKEENPQQCHICQKWCTRKWTLENHIKTHDEKNFTTCKTCNVTQKTEESNALHVRKQFDCEVCHIKICQKVEVKTHIDMHLEKIAMQCKSCKVSFDMKRDLRKHERKHQTDGTKRPFICIICSKSFKILRSAVECELNSHKDKWNCTTCHKIFDEPKKLRAHSDTHISDLFVCKICHPTEDDTMVSNKRTIFAKEFGLKKHLRLCHDGQKNISCHVCGKYFLLEVTLVHHMTDKHKDAWFKCEACNKKFRLKQTLEKHAKKTHIFSNVEEVAWFKCKSCKRKYRLKQTLEEHLKKTHSFISVEDAAWFKCKACKRKF